MLQPALMTAGKPESVGMPPGVDMMIQTEDKEVNGCTDNVDNIIRTREPAGRGDLKIGKRRWHQR